MNEQIKEAIEYKDIDVTECRDYHQLYDELDYDGTMHEIIDGMIDIYYYDIRKWAVDNWQYVQDAIDEGLCEGVDDYHQQIQTGQYVYYREESYRACKEVYDELMEELDETA